ncbi:MAG: transcription-repair coupling factor, partial [bacterium]
NASHPVLGEILTRLVEWRDAGARLHIAARTRTSAERLRELMAEFDVGVRLGQDDAPVFDDTEVGGTVVGGTVVGGTGESITPGHGSLETVLQNTGGQNTGVEKSVVTDITLLERTPKRGFRVVGESGDTLWALITEEELLGEKNRQRRLKKGKLQHFIASLGELKEGQLVVHVEYGIGRYEGLRRLEAGGDEGDFLHLSYAGGDKVYVPVSKLNLVQKFTGVDDTAPQLNRLGDAAWQRSKSRASKAIEDMAGELIATHARRKAREGHPFPPNRPMMTEFEEAFPYQETEDQETAIQEVLDDLSDEKPMDRLVCGDVGFGKTEVAMRAAYLAVLDGFQVMMLVPTTILAQQHFETFNQRFEPFAVNIEVISRFRTPTEQKKIAKRFAEGGVDILIGTHRLLSKDIAPGNLGLLIIDEEQRFGVAHKEKIKNLKTEVEVLALSATPIPRTLHMSLMGVRDLSIINTAPMDRIAVRTRLVKAGDYIITEAIEREVRRGGQVFVVENRVENIHAFGTYVQSLLPNLRLAIAHGQMPERQLEEVMLAFVKGEVDVLVSTSIIESGLDIPRANTILIHHADRFGLAQLYQLRGRVGRSNVQAYAYLLVSPEKVLTEVAQKRLTLLQELNDLGSGFKIASHDLEIRGAGNLVGREQSGHINNIGLELFTRMVEEAVGKLQDGKPAADRVECKLELGFPYLLPETYIPSTRQRLDVYKQLAEIRGEEELWQMRETLEDRFGKAAPELASLFVLIQVRLLAMRLGLSALENQKGVLSGRFGRPEWVELDELMTLVNDPTAGFQLRPGDRILMGPMPKTPLGVLERLAKLEPVVRGDRAAA